MQALLGEWHLTQSLFRIMFPQVLVVTVLVRVLAASVRRLVIGQWRTPAGLIVLWHIVALVIFSACNNFVDAGAPAVPESAFRSLVHSLSVLWLMQLFVLVPDFLVHIILRRSAGKVAV